MLNILLRSRVCKESASHPSLALILLRRCKLINFENKRNALLISSDNDVHDYYFTSNDFHFEQDLEQKRFPIETIGEIWPNNVTETARNNENNVFVKRVCQLIVTSVHWNTKEIINDQTNLGVLQNWKIH